MQKKKNSAKTMLLLHLLLLIYSVSGLLGKLAAGYPFLSLPFCLYYGGVIALLGIYAIGWQQVIKRMALTTAFANKAMTVVWGIVLGVLFFKEQITPGKLLGALLVMAGVALYGWSDGGEEDG